MSRDGFDGNGDILFAGAGDDLIDASLGDGGNRVFGQSGDDTFFAGGGDSFIGGPGDDIIFGCCGDNLLTGGDGADAFWILTGILPPGASIITDFSLEEDVIGIGGSGITSVDSLDISQVGDDAAIAYLGSELAVLQDTQASDLEANGNFVFA